MVFLGTIFGGLGPPIDTNTQIDSLKRYLERYLDEPVDIHRHGQFDHLQITAQQSNVRYDLNPEMLRYAANDPQELARQVGLGMQHAISQAGGNQALAQMAQQQMNLANQRSPYIAMLPSTAGLLKEVYEAKPGTIVEYNGPPPIWTPPPLVRTCPYCRSHVDPLKDCPHCGAPA